MSEIQCSFIRRVSEDHLNFRKKRNMLCSFPVVDALEAMLDAVEELVTEEQNDEGGVR